MQSIKRPKRLTKRRLANGLSQVSRGSKAFGSDAVVSIENQCDALLTVAAHSNRIRRGLKRKREDASARCRHYLPPWSDNAHAKKERKIDDIFRPLGAKRAKVPVYSPMPKLARSKLLVYDNNLSDAAMNLLRRLSRSRGLYNTSGAVEKLNWRCNVVVSDLEQMLNIGGTCSTAPYYSPMLCLAMYLGVPVVSRRWLSHCASDTRGRWLDEQVDPKDGPLANPDDEPFFERFHLLRHWQRSWRRAQAIMALRRDHEKAGGGMVICPRKIKRVRPNKKIPTHTQETFRHDSLSCFPSIYVHEECKSREIVLRLLRIGRANLLEKPSDIGKATIILGGRRRPNAASVYAYHLREAWIFSVVLRDTKEFATAYDEVTGRLQRNLGRKISLRQLNKGRDAVMRAKRGFMALASRTFESIGDKLRRPSAPSDPPPPPPSNAAAKPPPPPVYEVDDDDDV